MTLLVYSRFMSEAQEIFDAQPVPGKPTTILENNTIPV
jgi:hypothetical protein